MDTSDRDGSERVISPTVSREKWFIHARDKLLRGYVLIVGTERRNANFYKPARGYEMCPYKTAKMLIQDGIVIPGGEHYLGRLYVLSPKAAAELTAPARPTRQAEPSDAQDLDLLVDDLEDPADESSFETS